MLECVQSWSLFDTLKRVVLVWLKLLCLLSSHQSHLVYLIWLPHLVPQCILIGSFLLPFLCFCLFFHASTESSLSVSLTGWNELLIASFSHRSISVKDGILLATGLHVHRNSAHSAGVGAIFDRYVSAVLECAALFSLAKFLNPRPRTHEASCGSSDALSGWPLDIVFAVCSPLLPPTSIQVEVQISILSVIGMSGFLNKYHVIISRNWY